MDQEILNENAQQEKINWQRLQIAKGKIKKLSTDTKAYNVEDTTGDKAPVSEDGPEWDDYWKYWTKENFPAECADCKCSITASTRNGAHVRLDGETDNTKDAWIAILCDSCNNWQNKTERTLKSGTWLAKVVMPEARKNAKPDLEPKKVVR